MKKRIIRIMIPLLAAVFTAGCGAGAGMPGNKNGGVPQASRDIFAMDTYMNVTCYGERCEEALDAAEKEILRLDALLSIGNPDSEICRLNESGSAVLSDDAAVMTEKALELNRTTGGSFDITVCPLMELWGFTTQEFRVPAEQEIETVLETVGSEKMRFDPETHELTLTDGQGIDLGGIAKGYCSDRLVELFKEYDLVCGLVSLGGNVQCFGTKPDGSLWRCGIKNPFRPEDLYDLTGVVSVRDKAVITSGAYERHFTGEDGKEYHHILDPHTGYPAESGLASVTVVSESGILADALSTACYVMGPEGASDYWREYGEDFDLILVTEEGEVWITEPLQESFASDKTVRVITEA